MIKRLITRQALRAILPWMLLALFWPHTTFLLQNLPSSAIAMLKNPDLPVGQRPGINPTSDFTMFWAAGKLANSAQVHTIYDPAGFLGWRQSHLSKTILKIDWIYPPVTLLLTSLVAPLRFEPALLVWIIGLAAMSIMLLRRAALPWPVILAGLASPASLWNFGLGQLGLVTGSLFIAALLSVDRQPLRSGPLAGLLAFKPQAGLLMPVILLARRQWAGLVTASAVVLGLCLLTTLLYGRQIWPDYVLMGLPVSRSTLDAPFPTIYELKGISVFWMLRSLGCGLSWSMRGQVLAACLAVFACWNLWRHPGDDPTARMAVTVFLALLVSPYGYTSDLCAYSIALAMMAWRRQRLMAADVMLYLFPAISPFIAIILHAEIAPVYILLAALRAWRDRPGVETPPVGMVRPACYPAAS